MVRSEDSDILKPKFKSLTVFRQFLKRPKWISSEITSHLISASRLNSRKEASALKKTKCINKFVCLYFFKFHWVEVFNQVQPRGHMELLETFKQLQLSKWVQWNKTTGQLDMAIYGSYCNFQQHINQT